MGVEESTEETKYADVSAELDESQIVIFGIPFDGTSSHRTGAANAPMAIRRESYNYETFLSRYNFDIEKVQIYDMGNSKEFSDVNELINELPEYIKEIIRIGKFLITLGGEHSVTVPIVKTIHDLNPDRKLGVVYLDAHLDFRESYLDERYSHACAARRLSEIIDIDNIVEIGIRSYSKEESEIVDTSTLKIFTVDDVNKIGMQKVIGEALDYLDTQNIYLTIDMDVFDPAYAPGVGNPEYFGLTPWQVRDCIEVLGKYLIGADIVEVSPPFDNGNTAALAAQLIQIIISQVMKK